VWRPCPALPFDHAGFCLAVNFPSNMVIWKCAVSQIKKGREACRTRPPSSWPGGGWVSATWTRSLPSSPPTRKFQFNSCVFFSSICLFLFLWFNYNYVLKKDGLVGHVTHVEKIAAFLPFLLSPYFYSVISQNGQQIHLCTYVLYIT